MPSLTKFHRASFRAALLSFIVLPATHGLHADGIYRDGVGAKSMSLGGADVAWADDPLTSVADNPAGIGFMNSSMINLGGVSVLPEGHYSKLVDSNGYLTDRLTSAIEGGCGRAGLAIRP